MLADFFNSGLYLFPVDRTQDMNDIKAITEFCQTPDSPKLLFIDNLAEISSPEKDEYARQDSILRTFSAIRQNTGTTIVLLHHFAKPKTSDPISINSVKGNNIVITKADTVVALDTHSVRNFNWKANFKNSKGELADEAVQKKFNAYGPKIDRVRSVHVFKDRYYASEGHKGYMELVDGRVCLYSPEQMKDLYPLSAMDEQKLELAYAKFNLLPPDTIVSSGLSEDIALPWN